MATLVILLSVFRSNQPVAEVMRLLGQLYDFGTLKDQVFVLQASMKAEYDLLSEAVRSGLSAEELESFRRVAKLGDSGAEAGGVTGAHVHGHRQS